MRCHALRRLLRSGLVTLALLVPATALLMPGHVHAASLLEFDVWMQKIEKRTLSMFRNLKRSEGAAAAADAREVQALYKLMEDYFVARGDAHDAVKMSKDGVKLAETVALSATASRFDAAKTAATTLARACRDCHTDYKPLE